jgi:Leucine-rich repeat (LRR) protein
MEDPSPLQLLDLRHENICKISEDLFLRLKLTSEDLDKLKKLKIALVLSSNHIKKMKGLDKLKQLATALRLLSLGNNNITEIKGLDKLKNLQKLDLKKLRA